MHPANAIAAASHLDPYPYYRQLLDGPALVYDAGLRLWIASRMAVIEEVMANPHCVVRPPAEPVPAALAGTSAGAVFARLMRMNDGAAHATPKQVIGDALAAVDLAAVAERCAQLAATQVHGLPDAAALNGAILDLPTYVVADLLGAAETELAQMAQWVAHFVRCLAPQPTTQQLADAGSAAHTLTARLARPPRPGSLADAVFRRAARAGWSDMEAIVANLAGLLSQTHEASAALIGNSLVALLTQPPLLAQVRAEPQRAAAMVREVARYDPPVQNTRRFVAQATSVAGVALEPGAAILLLLAAAGRDERVHPQAGVFSLERAERQLSGFGHGRHACPGRELAFAIAEGAVRCLAALPLDAAELGWTYAPSANVRLPRFFASSSKGQP
jgi:cytochrome P450